MTTEQNMRDAAQASADLVIAHLREQCQPVPRILYRWGALMPDQRDVEMARFQLTRPDVRAVLSVLRSHRGRCQTPESPETERETRVPTVHFGPRVNVGDVSGGGRNFRMESIYESHPIGTVTRLEADLAAAAQRLEAVEAERDRLRAALEPFADYSNWDGVDEFEPPTRPRMAYVDAARAALGLPVSE